MVLFQLIIENQVYKVYDISFSVTKIYWSIIFMPHIFIRKIIEHGECLRNRNNNLVEQKWINSALILFLVNFNWE